MQTILRKILLLSGLVTTLIFWTHHSSEASSGHVNYSVETLPHTNQVTKESSYFDLLLESGQTTSLDLMIYNAATQEETFEINLVDASTNGNGLIVYENLNTSSEHPTFSTFAEQNRYEVKIDAGSSKKISIPIHAPDNSFKGVYLGGLRIVKKMDFETEETVGVTNRYAYVIGVKLSMGLVKETFSPSWKGAQLNTNQYYPFIDFKIDNETASISQPITVEMTVFDSKNVILRQEIEARFVPYASTALRVQIKKRLKAGDYKTHIVMWDKVNNSRWEWSDMVTVTEANQASIEKRVVDPEIVPSGFLGISWSIVLAMSGLVSLILFAYILYLRRRLTS